ncbi:MAG: AraC family transcriptional regulator [Desulfobacteraceae bacterium]|nr:AraC family transcriptional regulator [Desulfobacteraceae bacterium]
MTTKNENTLLEYQIRINRVINFVTHNLDKDLSLERLSREAMFSKFHFHRIFHALTGETVNNFISRQRLQKAAHMLIYDRRTPLTDIAFDSGFSSSQNFSKAFKKYFGIPPSQFRKARDFRNYESLIRKIGNKNSNPGKEKFSALGHDFNEETGFQTPFKINPNQRRIEMKVKIKEMPDYKVAYIRLIGNYEPNQIGDLFRKLLKWAGPRGLMNKDATVIGLSWDNPELTPEGKCRYDACITIPEKYENKNDIDVQTLKSGQFAVHRCEIFNDNFSGAWEKLMKNWLPQSGFQPDDKPCYEIYYNNGNKDPDQKWIVDLCLPVKPL